ncbi:hypothetical protein H8E88_15035 [candidate division KSB1 bacterium]|nr:hypothetical protein [candidate division KSB1 bacterium]MBL7094143.1 hypothetical protein [candidate division KSB1 bacterium]
MKYEKQLKNSFSLIKDLVRFNLKIIFANKFIYFLISAVIFFLLVTILNLANSDSNPTEGLVFELLLVPGILLIFYPTVFGIQSDVDTRMIEILFGIPNYRYKVWLIRIALIYFVVFFILIILSLLSSVALVSFPILEMVYQLMFPIFFLGSAAFMVSTLVRNGNGTAVVMVILGLAFWIGTGAFLPDKYNLFLNPFSMPSDVNEVVWADATLTNRIVILVLTLVCIVFGLIRLQKREKFV